LRIVSLSPAVSETLSLLGLEDNIVGVTPWCKMYLKRKEIPIVGTYLDINIEMLKKLNPDIVFIQAHVHDKFLSVLRSEGFNAYLVSLPTNLLDIVSNVEFVASLVDRYWEGKELADKLLDNIVYYKRAIRVGFRPRVYVEYLWPDKSFSTTGGLTYVDDAIRLCGGVNIFFDKKQKFFFPKDEEIISRNPQIIMVNIEPPFMGITLEKFLSIREPLKNTLAYEEGTIYLIEESVEANLAHPGPSFIINTLKRIAEVISSYEKLRKT